MGDVFLALLKGIASGVATDAAHDAYQHEVHQHPDEGPATHIAHAIGYLFGSIFS
jgi:hypothetical protein